MLSLKGTPAACRFATGRAGQRGSVARIGEIDLRGVEIKRAVEHDIQARAARQFEFGAARQHHRCDPRGSPRSRAYSRPAGTPSRNGAYSRARRSGLENGTGISPFVGVTIDIALLVGAFISAGPRVGRHRVEL